MFAITSIWHGGRFQYNDKMKKKQYYFDYAATTPLDKRVFLKMKPYFTDNFGNPSNLYEAGRKAKQAVSEATNKIAKTLNCLSDEVIFTSGATEADNLALRGVAKFFQSSGAVGFRNQNIFSPAEKISLPSANRFAYGRNQADSPAGYSSSQPALRQNRKISPFKIIISAVEHKGIMSVCDALAKEGFEIVKIPVNKFGLVDLKKLKKEIDKNTILVSITYADSETGTIQPIREIADIIKKFKGKKYSKPYILSPIPYFHTDASQAANYLDINVKNLGVDPVRNNPPQRPFGRDSAGAISNGVDLMTLSAHKIYGPKGIGGLYIKKGIKIKPIIFGGGQQSLRSGTQNVPAIVGFGEAISLTQKNKKSESNRVKKLRDKLEKGIFKLIPKVILNGHPKNRLPNFLNISILDIEGEALLLYLDEKGIAVGTGSACNSENLEPSYVLSALGRPYEHIHGSIRFTLGKYTKNVDINYVLKNLPQMVKKLRQISPLNLKINKPQKISQPKAFVGGQTPHFLRKKI